MALPGPKLRNSAYAIFLLCTTTVLIMLSDVAASGARAEARRCYWCGPLADQVHHSRRAPSCGSGDYLQMACEPGLSHCAVVATSPPYVESRFCVKLYQDECYPLFCNTTKSWKMTCPCREDLCNGPNTEREIEAFTGLSNLVAKTRYARIKKSADTLSQFTNTYKKKQIVTEESGKNDSNYYIERGAIVNMSNHDEKDIVTTDTINNSSRKIDEENLESKYDIIQTVNNASIQNDKVDNGIIENSEEDADTIEKALDLQYSTEINYSGDNELDVQTEESTGEAVQYAIISESFVFTVSPSEYNVNSDIQVDETTTDLQNRKETLAVNYNLVVTEPTNKFNGILTTYSKVEPSVVVVTVPAVKTTLQKVVTHIDTRTDEDKTNSDKTALTTSTYSSTMGIEEQPSTLSSKPDKNLALKMSSTLILTLNNMIVMCYFYWY